MEEQDVRLLKENLYFSGTNLSDSYRKIELEIIPSTKEAVYNNVKKFYQNFKQRIKEKLKR